MPSNCLLACINFHQDFLFRPQCLPHLTIGNFLSKVVLSKLLFKSFVKTWIHNFDKVWNFTLFQSSLYDSHSRTNVHNHVYRLSNHILFFFFFFFFLIHGLCGIMINVRITTLPNPACIVYTNLTFIKPFA